MAQFRKWLICLSLSLLSIFWSQASFADIWFEEMVGVSNNGVTFGLQANYADEDNMFSLRFLVSDDFSCCDSTVEASVNYGIRSQGEFYITTLEAGFGLLLIQPDDRQNEDAEVSFGIPFSAGIIFGKYLGVGLKLNLNVNPDSPFVGAAVNVAVGKFR